MIRLRLSLTVRSDDLDRRAWRRDIWCIIIIVKVPYIQFSRQSRAYFQVNPRLSSLPQKDLIKKAR